MASRWVRTMAKPVPAGWLPTIGDQVWMPRRSPFLRSATGTIDSLFLPGFFGVAYFVHGYRKRATVKRDELRPYRKPKSRRRRVNA